MKTGLLMDSVTALGLIAGTLTTLSFAPQVARAWRTRSTADLSLAMLIIFLAGILLWLAYGVVKEDLAIIAANAVTAVLIGLILSIKAKHG
ncbi:SemiSWEET family sugar transporter [Methanoculleus sp. 7T]|jgi:MtN3 and saliva related transmembrane protein|uniref:SemiSWEET family sugar transporter n=1 Tax=Methanoculleus sp. 7T TaxID=2937282 RepID=UPI0020BF88E6|nr:SemiSWEET transporter [Methanoculleus sp. 7T]MCK8519124.1 SemiSWEET transporter [Methanoculleus sp. 7T]